MTYALQSAGTWMRRHPWLTGFSAVFIALAALFLLLTFLPVTIDDPTPVDPLNDYDSAMNEIASLREADESRGDINPLCYGNAMTQGERTEQVIVFFHGFTSCPEQFRELGEQFLAAGYNIYIPRLPHHGYADRDGSALLPTSAEELAKFSTDSIDIAHGLGEEVIVAGLSGGGTVAAWTAQVHPDVTEAVLVAPFLGIGFIPTALNPAVARLIDRIPNINMWWDPRTRADNPLTASYSYPGYPLHALAEYLRLGFATAQLARTAPPAAESISVITNANDESVNNGITARLVDMWLLHGADYLRTYEFEKALELPHDLITPTREDGNPALVYPTLLEQIRGSS